MTDPTVTPSLSIPRSLLQWIDREADERGWTRSMLMREALRQWLKLHGTTPEPEKTSVTE